MAPFIITIDELKTRIGTADAPLVFDVRRRPVFDADDRVLPGARWRDHSQAGLWAEEITPGREIVIYCKHGHNVSQLAVAVLRQRGIAASTLEGGIEGWQQAGGLTIRRSAEPGRDEGRPSRWVTRVRPKIDRIACPWLIRRFIDPFAEFTFVAPEFVNDVATEMAAIPYDIEGVDFTHVGEGCTFDTLIDRFGLDDPALQALAVIVRGADTGRPDLAPEAKGLLAMSLGLSAICGDDDHQAVDRGMLFYDTLYAWLRQARGETHGWPPRSA